MLSWATVSEVFVIKTFECLILKLLLCHSLRSSMGRTREQYFLQFVLQGIVVMVQQSNAAAELGTAPYTDNVHV